MPAEPLSGTGRPPWHTLPPGEVCSLLACSPSGLSGQEASLRLAQWGPNELAPPRRIPPWKILLSQFKNVLIVILIFAALASAFMGHGVEAAAIGVIVAFAALLGFAQEFRAERSIEALRQMAAPMAAVLRDGVETEIPASHVVPGDLVLLRTGDRVPADLRLQQAVNLRTQEASLTGESEAVGKCSQALEDPELTLGDRRNMAYAGTTVSFGRGSGVVVATGSGTEFGKIAGMLQGVEEGRTPLQRTLDRLGSLLAKVAAAGVVVVILLGTWQGAGFLEMLIFGIALAVAVVPEALPAVVTISLALGVQRMVRRHALMRHLPAVETLGCTSVICTDKTGSLTLDQMTVRRCLAAGALYEVSGAGYGPVGCFSLEGKVVAPGAPLQRLLTAALLASDAELLLEAPGGAWSVKGDPTEGALLVAAAKAGLEHAGLDLEFPRLDEVPFSSETRRMITLHRTPSGTLACVKGAPEAVLASCTRVASADGDVELTLEGREALLKEARGMAEGALRVLAVASREGATRENCGEGLTFLGLTGMYDLPRPEVRSAISTCLAVGIRPVMITGDHPVTAFAVARELDLAGEGRVVTGAELDLLDQAALDAAVESIAVYARVSPAHKLRVVEAWQRRGEVVAMTGDGVNDAPALKKADIGIAMGVTGTAVSREAADLILTDDNFASIVSAVEEGRAIFDNIKKYLMYLLSSNLGEIGLMTGALLCGFPLPLTAVQILYVNLATDGLPALALAVDPSGPDLMRRPPRDPRQGIFTRGMVLLMLAGGAWSTAVNLSLFAWALSAGKRSDEARSMILVSLVLIEFLKAYCFRSEKDTALQRPFANRWLNLAVLWELVLLQIIVYLPVLQHPFGTFSLTGRDWLAVALAASSILPVLELVKWLQRRARRAR